MSFIKCGYRLGEIRQQIIQQTLSQTLKLGPAEQQAITELASLLQLDTTKKTTEFLVDFRHTCANIKMPIIHTLFTVRRGWLRDLLNYLQPEKTKAIRIKEIIKEIINQLTGANKAKDNSRFFHDDSRQALCNKINMVIAELLTRAYPDAQDKRFIDDTQDLNALTNLNENLGVVANPAPMNNIQDYANDDIQIWREYAKTQPDYAILSFNNQNSNNINLHEKVFRHIKNDLLAHLDLPSDTHIFTAKDKLNPVVGQKIKLQQSPPKSQRSNNQGRKRNSCQAYAPEEVLLPGENAAESNRRRYSKASGQIFSAAQITDPICKNGKPLKGMTEECHVNYTTNNSMFSGKLFNGLPFGQGTLTLANNDKIRGNFNLGAQQKPMQIVYQYSNHNENNDFRQRYEGAADAHGQPLGQGKITVAQPDNIKHITATFNEFGTIDFTQELSIHYTDGRIFSGYGNVEHQPRDEQPKGVYPVSGRLILANGDHIKCQFRHGQPDIEQPMEITYAYAEAYAHYSGFCDQNLQPCGEGVFTLNPNSQLAQDLHIQVIHCLSKDGRPDFAQEMSITYDDNAAYPLYAGKCNDDFTPVDGTQVLTTHNGNRITCQFKAGQLDTNQEVEIKYMAANQDGMPADLDDDMAGNIYRGYCQADFTPVDGTALLINSRNEPITCNFKAGQPDFTQEVLIKYTDGSSYDGYCNAKFKPTKQGKFTLAPDSTLAREHKIQTISCSINHDGNYEFTQEIRLTYTATTPYKSYQGKCKNNFNPADGIATLLRQNGDKISCHFKDGNIDITQKVIINYAAGLRYLTYTGLWQGPGELTFTANDAIDSIKCIYINGAPDFSQAMTITYTVGVIYHGLCNADFQPHGNGNKFDNIFFHDAYEASLKNNPKHKPPKEWKNGEEVISPQSPFAQRPEDNPKSNSKSLFSATLNNLFQKKLQENKISSTTTINELIEREEEKFSQDIPHIITTSQKAKQKKATKNTFKFLTL